MDSIETDRLILRNFAAEDAAGLFAYLHRPRAGCFHSLKLADIAAAEAEATLRSQSDEHVAVCLRSTGNLIGDLFCIPEEFDTYAVGWNFNADAGGVGFATEAARALFDRLFVSGQARRIYAYVEDDNVPSQRLCERLGMRQEGLFKEFVSFRTNDVGVPIFDDTRQYAILRREWQARRAD